MAGPDRPNDIPSYSGTSWYRQAALAVNWLLQRVGDYASAAALTALETLVGRKTGWGNYPDTAAAQVIAAATRTLVTVNGTGAIETQKPSDVTALWSANKITGRTGDAIVVKVQCTFTPDDATASYVDFEVDIGGSIGVVEQQTFTVSLGALMPHRFEWTFLAYTLGTWETNGGSIYITSDGPGSLSAKRVVVARAHKAF